MKNIPPKCKFAPPNIFLQHKNKCLSIVWCVEIENVFWNWAAILCSQDLWQHQLCRLSARHFITLLEGMFSILPHHLSTETSMGELGFCAFTSSPFVAKLNDSCLFAQNIIHMINMFCKRDKMMSNPHSLPCDHVQYRQVTKLHKNASWTPFRSWWRCRSDHWTQRGPWHWQMCLS